MFYNAFRAPDFEFLRAPSWDLMGVGHVPGPPKYPNNGLDRKIRGTWARIFGRPLVAALQVDSLMLGSFHTPPTRLP